MFRKPKGNSPQPITITGTITDENDLGKIKPLGIQVGDNTFYFVKDNTYDDIFVADDLPTIKCKCSSKKRVTPRGLSKLGYRVRTIRTFTLNYNDIDVILTTQNDGEESNGLSHVCQNYDNNDLVMNLHILSGILNATNGLTNEPFKDITKQGDKWVICLNNKNILITQFDRSRYLGVRKHILTNVQKHGVNEPATFLELSTHLGDHNNYERYFTDGIITEQANEGGIQLYKISDTPVSVGGSPLIKTKTKSRMTKKSSKKVKRKIMTGVQGGKYVMVNGQKRYLKRN